MAVSLGVCVCATWRAGGQNESARRHLITTSVSLVAMVLRLPPPPPPPTPCGFQIPGAMATVTKCHEPHYFLLTQIARLPDSASAPASGISYLMD